MKSSLQIVVAVFFLHSLLCSAANAEHLQTGQKAKTGHAAAGTAAAIPPAIQLPCKMSDFKSDLNVFVDPEIHDCDACTKKRQQHLDEAKLKQAYYGLEGDGTEPQSSYIAELNEPVVGAAPLLFFSMITLDSHLQSALEPELLHPDVDQIAFTLGQYQFLQEFVPAALKKATAQSKQSKAAKALAKTLTDLADPKLSDEKKNQVWEKGKFLAYGNAKFMRTFLHSLAQEYLGYLERPPNKQKYSPPPTATFRKFLDASTDPDIQTETYNRWVISWRDQRMAQIALKLICDAKDGKDVHLAPGMDHGPGMWALLSAALKAAGVEKFVKLKLLQTVTGCPTYLSGLLGHDPAAEKYRAFLHSVNGPR